MGTVEPVHSPLDAGCLPTTVDVSWLAVEDTTAVAAVRRAADALARRLGFAEQRVAEVGIVATELASNLRKHADEGVLLLRSARTGDGQPLVELVAVDSGPGMAEPARSWQDGRSTAGSLGIGLGAVARLADSHDLLSEPGRGSVFVARLHARAGGGRPAIDDSIAGLTRAVTGETVCGDAYVARRHAGRLSIMVCDGSGHGPLAAAASQRAVRVFCEGEPGPPEAAVARIHAALEGTRGGAVAVAEHDPVTGTVRYAGVGNISGSLLTANGRQSMVSLPGIAGYQARPIRAFEYSAAPGAVLVMHSDGLTDRWTADGRHRLLAAAPVLVAGVLLREAAVRRDDASVVVARLDAR
ncbi:MAG TPA: SpoIIE family protein phosphatase [Pseudonocardiaceae bacterium]